MWKYLKRRCEESNELAWGVAVGGRDTNDYYCNRKINLKREEVEVMNRGAMATTASSLPQLGEVAGALMEKGSRANEILDVIECKLFGG